MISIGRLREHLGDMLAHEYGGESSEVLQAIRFALVDFNRGRRHYLSVLRECNVLLRAHGVECIAEGGATYGSRTDGGDLLVEYVNMGDTYASTIYYWHLTGRFYVGSWGDFVERNWKLCGGES